MEKQRVTRYFLYPECIVPFNSHNLTIKKEKNPLGGWCMSSDVAMLEDRLHFFMNIVEKMEEEKKECR